MKNLFIILFLFSCIHSHAYNFNVTFENVENINKYIYLTEINDYEATYSGKFKIADSALIINNKAILKGLKPKKLYMVFCIQAGNQGIIMDGSNDNYIHFMSDGQDLNCKSNFETFTFSTTYDLVNNDNLLLSTFFKYYTNSASKQAYAEIRKDLIAKKSLKKEIIIESLKKAYTVDSLYYLNILKNTNSDILSTFLIYNMNYNSKSIDGLKKLVNLKSKLFNVKSKNTYVESFKNYFLLITSDYALEDFKIDLNNDFNFDMNSDLFSKKYVVFDLWASWCIPCRLEIKTNILPNLNNENVQFVGLNMDDDIKLAKMAIEKDKYNTAHLYCKNKKNSKLLKIIGLKTIPRYILVDVKNKKVNKNFNIQDLKLIL